MKEPAEQKGIMKMRLSWLQTAVKFI